MNGYTGEFSGRLNSVSYLGTSLGAGTYDIPGILRVSEAGSNPAYYDTTQVTVSQFCKIAFSVQVMRATGAATILPALGSTATTLSGTMSYNGSETAAIPLASGRWYVGGADLGGGGVWTDLFYGARIAVTSAGHFDLIIKYRPYGFPGWKNANVTGTSALAVFEPGIVNSAMGRAAAAADYADEIQMAKDEIGRRLLVAGIDLDKIPTDGVISKVGAYAPQAIATNLIPELCDPATYLALSIIHERYATRGEDWDAYKSITYRDRYETAIAQAIKTLPLNIDGDYQLDADEQNYGSPSTLSL